jgi:hypothetical protein
MQWLQGNSQVFAHWFTVIGAIATAIGVIAAICVASSQFDQIREQRRWQNFNDMNVRYANLFIQMPQKIIEGEIPFEKLEPQDKLWIRQYFDLTSEEYWLHEKKLIPEDMWERINSGVVVNLRKYPALIDGYYYWQGEGLFAHPEKFRSELEKAIATEKACAEN